MPTLSPQTWRRRGRIRVAVPLHFRHGRAAASGSRTRCMGRNPGALSRYTASTPARRGSSPRPTRRNSQPMAPPLCASHPRGGKRPPARLLVLFIAIHSISTMRDRIPPNALFDKGMAASKLQPISIESPVPLSSTGSTHSATNIISIPLKPGRVLFSIDDDDRGRHGASLSVVGL